MCDHNPNPCPAQPSTNPMLVVLARRIVRLYQTDDPDEARREYDLALANYGPAIQPALDELIVRLCLA